MCTGRRANKELRAVLEAQQQRLAESGEFGEAAKLSQALDKVSEMEAQGRPLGDTLSDFHEDMQARRTMACRIPCCPLRVLSIQDVRNMLLLLLLLLLLH